jgi:hypothetical protein
MVGSHSALAGRSRIRKPRVRDFAAIAYIPGTIANQGDASLLYDTERRAAMLRALLPSVRWCAIRRSTGRRFR